eukprot:15458082-Alexandrium_andersonii.AAC.1
MAHRPPDESHELSRRSDYCWARLQHCERNRNEGVVQPEIDGWQRATGKRRPAYSQVGQLLAAFGRQPA